MSINRIATNISALTAQRNVNKTGLNLQRSIERLSSGLRINRAGDDAAGLTVANRLRTQSQGLTAAAANAQDGINVISVAEGALDETTNRLSRIRELSIQAANTGVNDFGARQALQDEVFQNIDEITRIANTTLFGSNFLLNGDFSIKSDLKNGIQKVGVNIDSSQVASNLGNGTSFLNIRQIKDGFKEIVAGDPAGDRQILSSGIVDQQDQAVSLAFFSVSRAGVKGSGVSTATNDLVPSAGGSQAYFNGVSLQRGDIFVFSGVLADGVTQFNGSVSTVLSTGTELTFSGLVSTINLSIDNSEAALFGNASSVPSKFATTASAGTSGANVGRILFANGSNTFNQASINVTLIRNGQIVTSSNGVTRSGEIGADSVFTGKGRIGNSVTSITGSTFTDGEFSISVEDVQKAQQRKLESTIAFRDGNGTIISRTTSLSTGANNNTVVLNGSFVSGIYTGGTTLRGGDTITLTGTNTDGTTFQGTFTFQSTDSAANLYDASLADFSFNSISGLVAELNFRTRDYTAGSTSDGTQTRFEDAVFTFTTSGSLQLIDDYGHTDSGTKFTLTFNNAAGGARTSNSTLQDKALLKQEGFAEAATFRIEGGQAVRAESGDVVTLTGPTSTVQGIPTPQVTFRVGSGLTAGTDTFVNQRDLYTGQLNGGSAVTFQAGDQDVVFFSKSANAEPAKFVTVDFDSTIDVTSNFSGSDTGFTVLLSTVNRGLNFQIGSESGQSIAFSIGDLRSDNLGFGRGSGRSVADINITTLTGANNALNIVDEALSQVNRTRSILGAATNRLEATVSNLSVASENLTASESRIRDADIASETTNFTLNQVLLQAGVSVLAQANFQSQGFLQLLG
ncbi:MAG: hypothetical protein GC154_00170 [bacterium]|nr:hypothetical protein [bacterium]